MNHIEVMTTPTAEEVDWRGYLLANPDIATAGVDPKTHFLEHGACEGRKQFNPALFDPASPYRLAKFARFAACLDVTLSPSQTGFPMSLGEGTFDLADYESESANAEFGPFAHDVMAYPDRLYLDLGCGLRERLHANCLYLEVYPSLAADIIVSPNCTYPIKDNSFDGIGCFAVLEHTRQPWLVVREMRRMLKPGGKVWIDWPFLQPVHGYPSHFFNATREGLRTIFEDTGFKIDDIGAWDHQGPDFTLTWLLGFLLHNLPEPTRTTIQNMTVGDLLAHPPMDEFWRGVLAQIDDKTRSALACGNSLVATKQG
jgi:SAM-dependent methyltransferase